MRSLALRKRPLAGDPSLAGIPPLPAQPPPLGPRHILQHCPTSPLMSPERPFVGFPQSKCPSISRTRTAEGTILAGRTSCPEAAAGQAPGVLTVPRRHFPGSEEQGCLPSSLTPTILAPEKPSVPPSLALSHHLARSALYRSSQVSCMLPASGPRPSPRLAQPTGSLL